MRYGTYGTIPHRFSETCPHFAYSPMPKKPPSIATAHKVQIMGILNVTPDSFSDGGDFVSNQDISQQIDEMLAAGVDIIDVGGESTRPYAEPVALAKELARVIPAICLIRHKNATIPISIDTTKAEVARQAVANGATIINDISAFTMDPEMVDVVSQSGLPVVIMHMQGSPKNMQKKPIYKDVIKEASSFLHERVNWAVAHGVERNKIYIDPGIGFGKTIDHNLTILKHLDAFAALGCPLLIGHSRKSFIGQILDLEVKDRDTATAAISAICVNKGVAIIRVHDVRKTVQAVRITEAVLAAR